MKMNHLIKQIHNREEKG